MDTKKTREILILALRNADLMRPDAEKMEEAITNFMDDMEKQEHGCFSHIHTFLSKLPVPVHTKCRAMSHEIIHKVCEIVLWGNTDNTSSQSPEVYTSVY